LDFKASLLTIIIWQASYSNLPDTTFKVFFARLYSFKILFFPHLVKRILFGFLFCIGLHCRRRTL
jgi:hypothetical protein